LNSQSCGVHLGIRIDLKILKQKDLLVQTLYYFKLQNFSLSWNIAFHFKACSLLFIQRCTNNTSSFQYFHQTPLTLSTQSLFHRKSNTTNFHINFTSLEEREKSCVSFRKPKIPSNELKTSGRTKEHNHCIIGKQLPHTCTQEILNDFNARIIFTQNDTNFCQHNLHSKSLTSRQHRGKSLQLLFWMQKLHLFWFSPHSLETPGVLLQREELLLKLWGFRIPDLTENLYRLYVYS
jgi:hypothetical protein